MGAVIGGSMGSNWAPKPITQTSLTNFAGLSGYTALVKIPITLTVPNATYFRLRLVGPLQDLQNPRSSVFDNVTVSNAATSGDAFDSAAAPAAVTFGGSASLSLQMEQEALSDRITFTATGIIIVGFNVSSSPIAGTTIALRQSSPSGPIMYTHSALAEADDANRTSSGWTTKNNRSLSILQLEFS
jgi:hypothetical protein